VSVPALWILTDRTYLDQRMPRAVIRWLEEQGCPARVVVADQGAVLTILAPMAAPRELSPWEGLVPGDIVLPRSRHPFALALLKEAEVRGAVAVNPWSAVSKARNKVRGTLALARRGLPVPPTFLAHRPVDLATLDRRLFPLLLKPFQGDNARGIVLVSDPDQLEALEWPDVMTLAQPFVDVGGIDLKLYVVDRTVWATRRTSPLQPEVSPPVAAAVSPELADLALACGEAFGLRLYGIDVLQTEGGPIVVDVNDFPNYTGVPDAVATIGGLLIDEARQTPLPPGPVPAAVPG